MGGSASVIQSGEKDNATHGEMDATVPTNGPELNRTELTIANHAC
jgi:hypothetical protein